MSGKILSIAQTRIVELRCKVSEDVARRIFTDQQRTQGMIHGQAAIISALLSKFGVEGKLDLSADEHGLGISKARYVGAAYHPDGGVTVSFVKDDPQEQQAPPEEQEGPDAAG